MSDEVITNQTNQASWHNVKIISFALQDTSEHSDQSDDGQQEKTRKKYECHIFQEVIFPILTVKFIFIISLLLCFVCRVFLMEKLWPSTWKLILAKVKIGTLLIVLFVEGWVRNNLCFDWGRLALVCSIIIIYGISFCIKLLKKYPKSICFFPALLYEEDVGQTC